jgi:hypothetical protein
LSARRRGAPPATGPVGETGFEPAAPASRTQCSTGLSYSPSPTRCDTWVPPPTARRRGFTDGVGFEPTRAFAPHDFQSCSLSRSDTRPRRKRRGRDSNPREPFGPNALAGRRLKPLGHLSGITTAELHNCTTAELHDCTTAELHDRLWSCPSWARTRTLLIQSQTCCQLHQGAMNRERATGLEPATLSLGS